MAEEISPEIRRAWKRLIEAVAEYNEAVRELRSYPGVNWSGPNAELEVSMCQQTVIKKVEPL